MKRLLLILAIVLVELTVLNMTSHVPFASARTVIPAQTCFGDFPSCDGVKPPPISNCSNNTIIQPTTPLTIGNTTYGTLELHRSDGCFSYWGNVHATRSFTVTAVGMWEDFVDGSNEGALDRMPRNMVNGNNESTYMVGAAVGGCYHAAVAWSVNGVSQGIWNSVVECIM